MYSWLSNTWCENNERCRGEKQKGYCESIGTAKPSHYWESRFRELHSKWWRSDLLLPHKVLRIAKTNLQKIFCNVSFKNRVFTESWCLITVKICQLFLFDGEKLPSALLKRERRWQMKQNKTKTLCFYLEFLSKKQKYTFFSFLKKRT